MKSVLFTLVIFLTIAAQKCRKDTDDIPACIRQKIDSIQSQPKWNPPAEVYAYLYKGKKVFYFSSNCCDQYNTVFDEHCNYLCAPGGGITGGGDGKCSDFNSSATGKKLVWKDQR